MNLRHLQGTDTDLMSVELVNFDKINSGDVFMFSMKDRVEFKKTAQGECVSLRHSDETMDVGSGQLVFIKHSS